MLNQRLGKKALLSLMFSSFKNQVLAKTQSHVKYIKGEKRITLWRFPACILEERASLVNMVCSSFTELMTEGTNNVKD